MESGERGLEHRLGASSKSRWGTARVEVASARGGICSRHSTDSTETSQISVDKPSADDSSAGVLLPSAVSRKGLLRRHQISGSEGVKINGSEAVETLWLTGL